MVYGAKLHVKEATKVEPGTQLAEWDPFATPILTEVAGTVKFGDIIEGVTMNEQLDEVTGLSRKSIIERKRHRGAAAHLHQGREGQHRSSCRTPSSRRATCCRWAPTSPSTTATRVEAGDIIAQDPARDHQDQGHHRRSAARGRALRGAQAQGARRHHRDRRRGVSFGKDTKGKRKVVVTPEIDGKLRTDWPRST